jgi:hypothetical protein
MTKTENSSNDYAKNERKNTVRLRNWTGAWLVSMALAAFGPKLIWDFQTTLTIAAVLVNLAVGFGMIVAVRKHLQGLDDLQRKIFLDASALALGVGVVGGLAYELLEDIKLISYQPEISHLVYLICFSFLAGILIGNRKYR